MTIQLLPPLYNRQVLHDTKSAASIILTNKYFKLIIEAGLLYNNTSK